MFRTLFSLALLLALHTSMQGQAVRRYHQNLSLADATSIQMDAQGEVEIIKWAGSDVLIEVTVSSDNGSTAILNHLQKEGRYDLVIAVNNGVATLSNKQPKRQAIKAKGADMLEIIQYKISIPENFTVQGSSPAAITKARK